MDLRKTPLIGVCTKRLVGSSLYVDDILLTTNNLSILHEMKDFLSKNFEMKDMWEASCMIRIEIFHDKLKDFLGLSQKHILKEF